MEVYLEGHRRLRVPMKSFLRNAVRTIHNQSVTLNVEPCGSGDDAIKRCVKNTGSILLIDSEGEVSPQLIVRVSGQIGSTNRAFYMVQQMEAWFIADRDALADYFGPGFRESALPQRNNIEDAPKREIENGLRNATRDCAKQRYSKGRDDVGLLERLNPTTVYNACPNFALLINHLRELAAA
ncbi:MAG: DUF4276 family protein [Chloroflexi bacterium]|nr:DUF4276 family protein [Chloroflexota bacterium]